MRSNGCGGRHWLAGLCMPSLPTGLPLIRGGSRGGGEERRRVITEMQAFQDFARRVAANDPRPASRDSVVQGATLVVDSGDEGLEQVRQMYPEMVMPIDHYDEDNDESLRENMIEEFE